MGGSGKFIKEAAGDLADFVQPLDPTGITAKITREAGRAAYTVSGEKNKARKERADREIAAAETRAQAKMKEAADRKQLESEREDAASQRARARRRQRLSSKGEGRRSTIITDALGTSATTEGSDKTLLGL